MVRDHDAGSAVDVGPGTGQPDQPVRRLGLPQAEGRAGAGLQSAQLVQGRPQAAAGCGQALGAGNQVSAPRRTPAAAAPYTDGRLFFLHFAKKDNVNVKKCQKSMDNALDNGNI